MNASGTKRRFSLAAVLAATTVLMLALAVGAGPSGASALGNPGGTACSAAINGRGATFQTNAEIAFGIGFNNDVCSGTAVLDVDSTHNNFYNYPASTGFTGSGNGQKAASCRTDAFAGTDIPYNLATLAQLNGAPGSTGGCNISFTPPNSPNVPPFPDASDTQAQVMTFPVAAGAVGVGYDLSKRICGGTNPGTIKLTGKMVSLLAGGDIGNWNDPRLRQGGLNPHLASCDRGVTRVVRLDKSGTTQIYKNYLQNVDPNRSGAVCAAGNGWTFYAQDANNQTWPEGSGCSDLTRPATSGNAAVVGLCKTTAGAVCYGDIADFALQNLKSVKVRSATAGYVPPLVNNPNTGQKTQSNCSTADASLPGTTASDAVGLNATDTWATDNPSGNHGDFTDTGPKYPICGITFALVYTGLSSSPPNAISRLSLDQRQTLYDFFSYVLSSTGQAHLGENYYAPIASAWQTKLLAGFQANF